LSVLAHRAAAQEEDPVGGLSCPQAHGVRCIRRAASRVAQEGLEVREDVRDLADLAEHGRDSVDVRDLADLVREERRGCCPGRPMELRVGVPRGGRHSVAVAISAMRRPKKVR